MSQRFFLDPDYETYHPGVTPLKTSTVMNGGLGCGGSLVVLVLFIPLALIMFSSGWQLLTDRFDHSGTPAEATLVSCSWQRGVARNESSKLYLSYSFIDHNRQERLGTDMIYNGQNRCGELVTGDTIQIRYMAFDTSVVDERFLPPVWFVGGVSMLAFVGFGFMSLMILYAVRQGVKAMTAHSQRERLEVEGVILDGEVVEANGSLTGKAKDAYQVSVKYRVKLPDGRGIVRSQTYRRDDLRDGQLPSPGTPVAVLYAGDECYVML